MKNNSQQYHKNNYSQYSQSQYSSNSQNNNYNNNNNKNFKPYIPCANGTKCKHYAKGTCTFLHNFQNNKKQYNNNNNQYNNGSINSKQNNYGNNKSVVVKTKILQKQNQQNDDSNQNDKKQLDILVQQACDSDSNTIEETQTDSTAAESVNIGEWEEDQQQQQEKEPQQQLIESDKKSAKKQKKLRLDSTSNFSIQNQGENQQDEIFVKVVKKEECLQNNNVQKGDLQNIEQIFEQQQNINTRILNITINEMEEQEDIDNLLMNEIWEQL